MDCNCSDHDKLRRITRRLGKRVDLVETILGDATNACVDGDGRVSVTRNLLRQLTEGELVMCLQHELAHARLGHIDERANLSGVLNREYRNRLAAGEPESQVRADLKLRFTRAMHEHEYQADQEGAESAIRRSGVSAAECVSALRKTLPQGDDSTHLMFVGGDHPPLADRIDRLARALIKKGYL